MIRRAAEEGARAAIAAFKLSNLQQGAAAYNPVLTGQSGAAGGHQGVAPPAAVAPPAPPAAPAAAGISKSKVLG